MDGNRHSIHQHDDNCITFAIVVTIAIGFAFKERFYLNIKFPDCLVDPFIFDVVHCQPAPIIVSVRIDK